MTLEEAKNLVKELERYVNENIPFNSTGKDAVEKLYYNVFGKTFTPTSCQQCYHDALVEIPYYLKNGGTMAEKKNYVLRAGVIINCPNFYNGKVFSNENLTDKIAEEYLKAFPEQKEMFEELPEEENEE